jgi:hypothetical protein
MPRETKSPDGARNTGFASASQPKPGRRRVLDARQRAGPVAPPEDHRRRLHRRPRRPDRRAQTPQRSRASPSSDPRDPAPTRSSALLWRPSTSARPKHRHSIVARRRIARAAAARSRRRSSSSRGMIPIRMYRDEPTWAIRWHPPTGSRLPERPRQTRPRAARVDPWRPGVAEPRAAGMTSTFIARPDHVIARPDHVSDGRSRR